MALTYPGFNSTSTANSSTHVANLPGSIDAGDLIVVAYRSSSAPRTLVLPASWDGEFNTVAGASFGLMGFLYKIADGLEGATQSFSVTGGSEFITSLSFTVRGYDESDPFNGDNWVAQYEASEDPWTISSGLLTGVANSDSDIVTIGATNTSRTIVAQDSGQVLIGSETTSQSLHALRETSPGSSNSAYSNDMSGTREWLEMIIEIKAASSGIPILRRRREG